MLRSFGSDGCPAEPQSLLCTGGVSLVSPASSPRVSSSSALGSSPTCGGPARFSPLGERCRGLAAFGQSGGKLCPSCVVPCEPPLVLVVHFHPLSSYVLLGSASSPSSSWPRFLPLVLGPSPPRVLPVVFLPTVVPSASSRPSLTEESSSP